MILAKNLPAGTLAAELQETFSRFGSLGRVLLPEGGITAIVEFLEPLEARKAFRHLAYSKVGLPGLGEGCTRAEGCSRPRELGQSGPLCGIPSVTLIPSTSRRCAWFPPCQLRPSWASHSGATLMLFLMP